MNGWLDGWMDEADLVSDPKGDDIWPWAVFERVGRLVLLPLLDEVSMFICPRQQQIPPTCGQGPGFSPDTFEPVGLLHRVPLSFFNEVRNVIEPRVGRVLGGEQRAGVWGQWQRFHDVLKCTWK